MFAILASFVVVLFLQIALTYVYARALPSPFVPISHHVKVDRPVPNAPLTYGYPFAVGDMSCDQWQWMAYFQPEVRRDPDTPQLYCVAGYRAPTFAAHLFVANVVVTAAPVALAVALRRRRSPT